MAALSLSYSYYCKITELLEEHSGLQSSVSGICKQTLFCATGTIVGGCLGGPPGAAVGGLAGVYFGYRTVHDYMPLLTVLRNMTDVEQKRLVNKVQELVGAATMEELLRFVATEAGRSALFDTVRAFVRNVDGMAAGTSAESKYPKFD